MVGFSNIHRVDSDPVGRLAGTLNMATMLERALDQRVSIGENGPSRITTKLEAVIKQLVNSG